MDKMIGIISFTHSIPLYLAYPHREMVRLDTPKRILGALQEGEIGCGMISLLEYLQNRNIFSLEPEAVIRSPKQTMSTLLVSDGAGLKQGITIAVTDHTRTTQFYLEYILRRMGLRYEIMGSRHTEADDLLKEAHYALVIGDEALRVFQSGHRIIWDIGYQFNLLTSLSPVFAVTVRRKDSECTDELVNLGKALAGSRSKVAEAVEIASGKTGIRRSILERYYSTIRYDYNAEAAKTVAFVDSLL